MHVYPDAKCFCISYKAGDMAQKSLPDYRKFSDYELIRMYEQHVLTVNYPRAYERRCPEILRI